MNLMDDAATSFILEEPTTRRLDTLLHERFPDCSRTYFQFLIEQGHVLVNNKPCKKRHQLAVNDEVFIHFLLTKEISVEPEEISLDILFEDEDIIAVNKPAGMVVHPAPGHWTGTFVHALLFHCKTLPREGDTLRPGIVHRLDKDTSGILLAAKNSYTHQALVNAFSHREIHKTYHAVCHGTPTVQTIQAPIGRHPRKRQEMCISQENGKLAITQILSVCSHKDYSWLTLSLITGRTHQIRVHLRHIGHPILGDPIYGKKTPQESQWRQLLHAYSITLPHPRTREPLTIIAPIPDDMQRFQNSVTLKL